jgi:hypothetical protein
MILESKLPKDAAFRTEMIGEPFWAESQGYEYLTTGKCHGFLMSYWISRGGRKKKIFGLG